MPHADSALVPESIQTKAEFWQHVHFQIESLLDGQRHWISNLANASSVIFNSLLAFPKFFGRSDKAVNWCGFYIHSKFFPVPRLGSATTEDVDRLLLGPFCGKPACQYIMRQTLVIADVDSYPGHIACDGDTKSEIVIPLILDVGGESYALGVLDLDCLALNGFDDEDKVGLKNYNLLVMDAIGDKIQL
ncbi:hypothetical protein BJ912DRAFT_1020666 [Pholiota molesta]|nr:hypothetical protein BJ912DRAFT_1020666 [Pholiota molesta]